MDVQAMTDILETYIRPATFPVGIKMLAPGEAFASSPFQVPGFEQRIWPGAEIELEAEGIGVLRNRIGRP